MGNYGVTLEIWDHTMLLATRQSKHSPPLPQPVKADIRFTYLGGIEG